MHTTKYSETSIIARIYTEKFGLLSFMVKGVRSAKSKSKASMMQPLSLLDLEFQYHENRGLLYIKEFTRAHTYLTTFRYLKNHRSYVFTRSDHQVYSRARSQWQLNSLILCIQPCIT